MRMIHLSDLHLGRMLNKVMLRSEQEAALSGILQICREEKPDAVLIAGDIYDKGIPPVYAVTMLENFLNALREMGLPVFLISGNHDSPERLGFLSGALMAGRIYVSPAYEGDISPIVLQDAEGPVHIWLMPFLKLGQVRAVHPEEPILTTHDAVAAALRHMNMDKNVRNVLVAHQFVKGAHMSGSEEAFDPEEARDAAADQAVGGSDAVDGGLFSAFDYVALGHLHGPQNVGTERIRYCGTVIPYSFDEEKQLKSVSIIDLHGDRSLTVRVRPLEPAPLKLRTVVGTLRELTHLPEDHESYIRAIVTDENPGGNLQEQLRFLFERLTFTLIENSKTKHAAAALPMAGTKKQPPMALFRQFYEDTNGAAMTAEQSAYMEALIREVWGDEQ